MKCAFNCEIFQRIILYINQEPYTYYDPESEEFTKGIEVLLLRTIAKVCEMPNYLKSISLKFQF